MKKVVILKQTQVTMKTFVPPFFDHFSLNLSKKKKKKKKKRRVVMRALRKKLNIFTYQLPIY